MSRSRSRERTFTSRESLRTFSLQKGQTQWRSQATGRSKELNISCSSRLWALGPLNLYRSSNTDSRHKWISIRRLLKSMNATPQNRINGRTRPYLERDLLTSLLPRDLLRLRSGEAGGDALRLLRTGDASRETGLFVGLLSACTDAKETVPQVCRTAQLGTHEPLGVQQDTCSLGRPRSPHCPQT